MNSATAIIVLQAARLVPQTVWFMQNFIDAVPRELDEAANIDGATRFQTFTKIILPLNPPGHRSKRSVGGHHGLERLHHGRCLCA